MRCEYVIRHRRQRMEMECIEIQIAPISTKWLNAVSSKCLRTQNEIQYKPTELDHLPGIIGSNFRVKITRRLSAFGSANVGGNEHLMDVDRSSYFLKFLTIATCSHN